MPVNWLLVKSLRTNYCSDSFDDPAKLSRGTSVNGSINEGVEILELKSGRSELPLDDAERGLETI